MSRTQHAPSTHGEQRRRTGLMLAAADYADLTELAAAQGQKPTAYGAALLTRAVRAEKARRATDAQADEQRRRFASLAVEAVL